MSRVRENIEDDIVVVFYPVNRSPPLFSREIVQKQHGKVFDFPFATEQFILLTSSAVEVHIKVAEKILRTIDPLLPASRRIDLVADKTTQIMIGANWVLSRPISNFGRKSLASGVKKLRAQRAITKLQGAIKAGASSRVLVSKERKAARLTVKATAARQAATASRVRAIRRARWLVPARVIAAKIFIPLLVVATIVDIILITESAAKGSIRAEQKGQAAFAGFIGGGVAGVADAVTLGLLPESAISAVERKTTTFLDPVVDAIGRPFGPEGSLQFSDAKTFRFTAA